MNSPQGANTCRESAQIWKRLYDEKMDAKFSKTRSQTGETPVSKVSPGAEMRKKGDTQERYQENKLLFDQSQVIEMNGEPHYCEPNGSRMNCNFVPEAQFKCACQKYYTQRKHLNCSCDPSGFFLLEGLTEDRCRRKGYLEDDYPKLAHRMQVTYDNIHSTAMAPPKNSEVNRERTMLDLHFPPHNCPACDKEFLALEEDWAKRQELTWENLRKLSECIEGLSKNQERIQVSLSPGWENERIQPPLVSHDSDVEIDVEQDDCSCTGSSTPVPQARRRQPTVPHSRSPRSHERGSTYSLSTPSASSYTAEIVEVPDKKTNPTSACWNGDIMVARVSDAIRAGFAALEGKQRLVEEKLEPHPAQTSPLPSTSPKPTPQNPPKPTAQNIPPDVYSHLMQGGAGTEEGTNALGPSYVNPFVGTSTPLVAPAATGISRRTYWIIVLVAVVCLCAIFYGIYLWNGNVPFWGGKKPPLTTLTPSPASPILTVTPAATPGATPTPGIAETTQSIPIPNTPALTTTDDIITPSPMFDV